MIAHDPSSRGPQFLLALATWLVTQPALVHADGRTAELVAICSGCHGEKGIPQEKTTPVIWGQSEGYIYLQMRDFQKGVRKSEQMQAVVDGLDKSDLRALAAHFTKLEWPNLEQADAPPPVIKKAEAVNTSVGCTGCHQGEYEGDGTTPRLAGQSLEYLKKAAADFRSGARTNNPGMANILRSMDEGDVAAMVEYLAGLRLLPSAGRR